MFFLSQTIEWGMPYLPFKHEIYYVHYALHGAYVFINIGVFYMWNLIVNCTRIRASLWRQLMCAGNVKAICFDRAINFTSDIKCGVKSTRLLNVKEKPINMNILSVLQVNITTVTATGDTSAKQSLSDNTVINNNDIRTIKSVSLYGYWQTYPNRLHFILVEKIILIKGSDSFCNAMAIYETHRLDCI